MPTAMPAGSKVEMREQRVGDGVRGKGEQR